MMFDSDDREPGDELEDFGEDLSSDYREEEDELGVDDGEMPEEEISYEVEAPMGRAPQIVSPPPPAPAKAARRAPAPRKPAKKAVRPPKKTAKKPAKKAEPAKKAAKPKKAKKPAKAKKTAAKKKSKRR
jgi:hypothetical protein